MFLRLSYYWLNYIVVRWQLLITLLVAWFAIRWLRAEYGQDDSNLWLVMGQFIRIIQWTIVGLFIVSTLVAIITWAYFLINVRKNRINVHVQLGDGHKAEAGFVPLTISLAGPVIRPLLGTIRARLIFSEKRLSEPITLDTDMRKKKSLFRFGIKGSSRTLLYDRGIYDVEQATILFCDMFNLISLPVTIKTLHQLYTLPRPLTETSVKAQPNTTEEQKHRIEIPKRVEGEYINYKEFETGDNIRRIVWKIYAKSGQLVVRIPETKDPYASHLYFYTSFYDGFNLQNGLFDTELLNVYKDKVRNLFEALRKNEYDIRIPQDQEVPKLPGVSEKKNELFQITAADWQRNNPPSQYVSVGKAAFVCLSALAPPADVEELLRKLPLSVPVVVVKLSDSIPSPFRIRIKDLFFRPAKHPNDGLRKPWLVSPLRQRLIKNEQELERVIKRRGNGWLVNSIDVAA